MIPEALLTAAIDPELRPRDLSVYVFRHAHLDDIEYRPVKQTWLARVMHWDRPNLTNALHRLVDLGYLELSPEGGGRGAPACYRIPLSPTRGPFGSWDVPEDDED